MSSDKSIIEIISLENRPTISLCVTDKMLEIIDEQKKNNKKTLIFYNRRGSAGAYICRDCWYFEKCQNCDIAFSYHNFPKKILLCHQCNTKNHLPYFCPNCKWNNFTEIGIGIEKIADSIKKEKNISVWIIDSDHTPKLENILETMENNDVIIATAMANSIVDDRIGAVIFALFEVNFSVPNYQIEEELYSQIVYIKKQNKPLYIQTFSPEYPLLQEIVFGNFKSFLNYLKKERKNFNYPPYSDFAIIRIYHRDKKILQNNIIWIVERIKNLPDEILKDIFLAYDNEIYEKYHWDFMQKITLKWRWVHDILENISSVIIRNKNIFVDWQ